MAKFNLGDRAVVACGHVTEHTGMRGYVSWVSKTGGSVLLRPDGVPTEDDTRDIAFYTDCLMDEDTWDVQGTLTDEEMDAQDLAGEDR